MSFTYIISSRDDVSDRTRANNCYIPIGNLPAGTRFFRCRVLNFTINTASLTAGSMDVGSCNYVSLVCDNLLTNGGRSGNNSLNILATYSVDCPFKTGEVFNIVNPNGNVMNFRLLDEFEAIAQINQNATNTVWMLTLELTPFDDCC